MGPKRRGISASWPRAATALVVWLALPELASSQALSITQDLNLALVDHTDLESSGIVRYKDIVQHGVKEVDLLVLLGEGRDWQDASLNGNFGEGKQIGDISIKAGSKAGLIFKFVFAGTKIPVAVDFYLTLFVTSPGEQFHLSGSLANLKRYCLSAKTLLETVKEPQQLSFKSSAATLPLKPHDPFTLPEREQDQTVTLFFVKTTELHVDADFTNVKSEGNLSVMFSGTAAVQERCTPGLGQKPPAEQEVPKSSTTAMVTTVAAITAATSTSPAATAATTSSGVPTTTTWGRCRPAAVAMSYDCEVRRSTWSQEQEEWCRQHKGRAATTTTLIPFDCHAGLASWSSIWSPEKRSWCCEHCELGCRRAATPDAKVVVGGPFACGTLQPLAQELQTWSQQKRTWCCHHRSWSCPQWTSLVGTSRRHDCAIGSPSSWDHAKRTWCCVHHSKGCDLTPSAAVVPYDCTAALSAWRIGWSEQKQSWCCKHRSLGCDDDKTEMPAPDPYGCETGLDSSWETRWSNKRKDWCCRHRGRGCHGKAAPSDYDCDSGVQHWEVGWSYRKKQWCCHNQHKGCALDTPSSEPFDCTAGFMEWRDSWSLAKRQYCCSQYNRGCAASSELFLAQGKFAQLRRKPLVRFAVLRNPSLLFVPVAAACMATALALVVRCRRRNAEAPGLGARAGYEEVAQAPSLGARASHEEVAQAALWS